MRVLRTIDNRYGAGTWSRYGFVDAFNPLINWYDSDVVGIDSGITIVMAENARTAFVWDTFMKNPEAQRGMERAGFKTFQPLAAQERWNCIYGRGPARERRTEVIRRKHRAGLSESRSLATLGMTLTSTFCRLLHREQLSSAAATSGNLPPGVRTARRSVRRL